jgi:hypothetical protein
MTSQFVGANPNFKNWGAGMKCEAPIFSVAGTVTVPARRADGDLTAGFMQALVACTGPTGRYWTDDDQPYRTAFAPYSRLPLRDGDAAAGGVFYGPEAQHLVDSPTVDVQMKDQPQTSLPWKTPDGKGRLEQIVGEHQFITWLVTHSDSTGKVEPLRWISWRIGWFAAVDESNQNGTAFEPSMVTSYGEGAGPMQPIRSGPVANDAGEPTVWLNRPGSDGGSSCE